MLWVSFHYRYTEKMTLLSQQTVLLMQQCLSYTSFSCKSHSFVCPIGIVSIQNTLHGVEQKIIFTCTSISLVSSTSKFLGPHLDVKPRFHCSFSKPELLTTILVEWHPTTICCSDNFTCYGDNCNCCVNNHIVVTIHDSAVCWGCINTFFEAKQLSLCSLVSLTSRQKFTATEER